MLQQNTTQNDIAPSNTLKDQSTSSGRRIKLERNDENDDSAVRQSLLAQTHPTSCEISATPNLRSKQDQSNNKADSTPTLSPRKKKSRSQQSLKSKPSVELQPTTSKNSENRSKNDLESKNMIVEHEKENNKMEATRVKSTQKRSSGVHNTTDKHLSQDKINDTIDMSNSTINTKTKPLIEHMHLHEVAQVKDENTTQLTNTNPTASTSSKFKDLKKSFLRSFSYKNATNTPLTPVSIQPTFSFVHSDLININNDNIEVTEHPFQVNVSNCLNTVDEVVSVGYRQSTVPLLEQNDAEKNRKLQEIKRKIIRNRWWLFVTLDRNRCLVGHRKIKATSSELERLQTDRPTNILKTAAYYRQLSAPATTGSLAPLINSFAQSSELQTQIQEPRSTSLPINLDEMLCELMDSLSFDTPTRLTQFGRYSLPNARSIINSSKTRDPFSHFRFMRMFYMNQLIKFEKQMRHTYTYTLMDEHVESAESDRTSTRSRNNSSDETKEQEN